ncbi:hypothetical protein [Plantactinospora sp. B5E13]|uniref:hypothetical protein n=1 Tax=unclassified Plantactinospora TaxID=2631981 RepID=UPI00325D635C
MTGGLAVALLVAGCGGDGTPAGPSWVAAAPSATPESGPTSAPVALSLGRARARYLEIVRPYNTALEAFESAAQAGRAWTALRPLAAKVAAANRTHGRALRDTTWPARVREPVTALLRETDAAQREWERAARAETAAELLDAVNAAIRHSGAKQAGAVRSALGLAAYTES